MSMKELKSTVFDVMETYCFFDTVDYSDFEIDIKRDRSAILDTLFTLVSDCMPEDCKRITDCIITLAAM